MELTIPSVQTRSLKSTKNPEDYKLYRAALEWALIEPIVIDDRNDIRSESKWLDLVEPYHHQVTNLITFCRRLPVTLLADDVGLGKTISAGLVMSELITRNRISKVLIVCPKILMPQWKEELDVKFGIPSILAIGNELADIELPDEACAVITTYNSARLHFEDIESTGFDMLILDEAHKLRNLFGVDNPPQVALRFKKALADRLFKFVLMLTATPIQNRLWDLYSLVDLLTVARGHENPFGNPGMFARKFIADNRTQARHLKLEMKDEFRSIVYGYMSRVRRGDANLHFPERVILLHKVAPTTEEIELIKLVAESIQNLNFLTQIIILQAVISSPEALVSMLNKMAIKGTIQESFAADVRSIAGRIKLTAKLRGLSTLVHKLRDEQQENWRMVVFTRWRETQTTIEAFLEAEGIPCGLINGNSSQQNPETLKKFKANPPEINVIVSTEAGSEGINLQSANVLINYDLPWNPMIVEQRIGRIQRLASEHASVCIFNIILEGTFEEYIVGRLMEKLQMASHAIGDIEALLEATELDDIGENCVASFEERIRRLVMASLAGKDIEAATRSAEKSISEAKIKLEQEENNINTLLGGMEPDFGPQCPKLPDPIRTMDPKTFVLAALTKLGAEISELPSGLFASVINGRKELIRFNNDSITFTSTLYAQGTPAFERLVSAITNLSLHNVTDEDSNSLDKSIEIAKSWIASFGGTYLRNSTKEIYCCFEGIAIVRVRATVAHDSYERLVEINCSAEEHYCIKNDLELISDSLSEPSEFGLITEKLKSKAIQDPGISEFCRFYLERMSQELTAAGRDERKRKKLEDDFTPRIEISLVGIEGKVRRKLQLILFYSLDLESEYSSSLLLSPSLGKVIKSPRIIQCEISGQYVPQDCLDKCQISKKYVMKHLLIKSEQSNRLALPEYVVECNLTRKKVLNDEVLVSAVSGEQVISSLLKTSILSGKKAEPNYFGKCEFTGVELLKDELELSQISGKRYRIDEKQTSSVSGKTGHKQEFIFCTLTNQPILENESEKCEVTGKTVTMGLLRHCEVSGFKALPSELEKSTFSGKLSLKKYMVSSSVSGSRLLEQEAMKSSIGKYCTPLETKLCNWSGQKYHPDDLMTCELSGLPIYFEFMTSSKPTLETLINLLNGYNRNNDVTELWETIASKASQALGVTKCKVVASESSPDSKTLAVSLEIRTWVGLKVRHAGFLFNNGNIKGKIIIGKRVNNKWEEEIRR